MDEIAVMQILTGKVTRQEEPGWLAGARTGQQEALEQFYQDYHAQVYRLCYRLLGRSDDAEDAMQAAFVRAFRALPKFRGDCAVRTWLYRIAVNEALTLQRRRRHTPTDLPDSLPTADAALRITERIVVRETLAQMRPDQRALLVLLYWEEMSYEEIAAILEISLSAVKMRLNRARNAFQKRYEGGEG